MNVEHNETGGQALLSGDSTPHSVPQPRPADAVDGQQKRRAALSRDPAAVARLKQLAVSIRSNNISTARVAAFNLSWMQEDGLAILSEILMGNFPPTAKKAAAYGLRSMNGRMKKLGAAVLEQGLKNNNPATRAICAKSLLLMRGGTVKKEGPRGDSRHRGSGRPRAQIQEIRRRSRTGPAYMRPRRSS